MLLAIDVGRARVGLAIANIGSELVLPIEAVPRSHALVEIQKLIAERGITEVFVGNPINLRGDSTLSTEDALEFARELAKTNSVKLVDERLTTALVLNQSKGRGKPSQIDSLSAAEILKLVISNPASAKDIDG